MAVWPRFLLLLFPNNLAWCCMETVFLPAHLGRLPRPGLFPVSSQHPEEDSAPSSRGEGAAVHRHKGSRAFLFPFLKQGCWGAFTPLLTVLLAVEEGKERGTGTSPRFGSERCTAEVSPTPPCNSRPATCNHSPSRLKRRLMWCQQEGTQTPPRGPELW